jgi:glycosyltransferase involved in cell wall biosynthesis
MLGPDSHNPEERRFVEELKHYFGDVVYLRGIGIKSLRLHQLASIPARLGPLRLSDGRAPLRMGSLKIIPFRKAATWLNRAWLHRQLLKLADGRPDEWIFWTRFPSPELVSAVIPMPFAQLVYEPIDRYASAPNFSKRERRLMDAAEAQLLHRATVVTGGRGLAERFRTAAGGSHWLPFGSDLDHQSRGTGLPAAIKRPRLLVVGRLDWRLDESILLNLMERHPEWNLVMAGPRVSPWGSRLRRLANVHWLGQVPSERVRPVIAACDVTLIPYHLSEWTRACLPVKLFDYLREGKPVVSTTLPELEPFGDVVRLAAPDQFTAAVEQAITPNGLEGSDQRRRAAVRFTLQERARRAAALLEAPAIPAMAQ